MQTERLSTLDEFGGRNFVIPAEVKGRFRKARTRVYTALLVVFVVLPWIKINGLQAMLLDIPHRRFEIFGNLFLAHDTPLLFLLLAFLVLSLAAVTAAWGRVWCGWACPQTVFIDALYRQIEIWIEGDYVARRKLRAAPMTGGKFLKIGGKWTAYFVVSALIAHSFIAYFTGADRLLLMIASPPGENWTYFLLVFAVTSALVFNFGWFREQFCIIMCPYGRFQSVLMDADTITVAYDEKRGEPRRAPGKPGAKTGDCIGCNRCVQVCPTQIDIRNGAQLECTNCTACMDACDEMMRRVHKPERLIGYRSLAGKSSLVKRPRVLALASLALICLLSLVVITARRDVYALSVFRAADSPYQLLPQDLVLNHFKVHVINQSQGQEEFRISLPPDVEALGAHLTKNNPATTLQSGDSAEFQFFVTFPKTILGPDGGRTVSVQVNESVLGLQRQAALTLVGPQNINPKE